jgi:fructose-specific phosphotransferase system IIC component
MKRTIIRLVFASVAACSLATQPAMAMGCIQGAALGGVAGHMAHHTFLGLFGGCAGGMVVHHLYSKWKAAHPDGTMKDFVADNKDKLPAGWADRLNSAGAVTLTAGHQ